MASAWGLAFGKAWGKSWGAIEEIASAVNSGSAKPPRRELPPYIAPTPHVWRQREEEEAILLAVLM